eukprot:NODE_779_length_1188_cov_42.165057_g629_i0.p8 GENE.NODE_779_length_1188_cov_42.165057_g629_i0~~NODE_779_length_1188_cov_42.165057_g629_i0.p8  ORF type:complete len:51 (-),score=17.20 NODE_779_length_1188_cov_42.165057_g629_i0:325-477(-)
MEQYFDVCEEDDMLLSGGDGAAQPQAADGGQAAFSFMSPENNPAGGFTFS